MLCNKKLFKLHHLPLNTSRSNLDLDKSILHDGVGIWGPGNFDLEWVPGHGDLYRCQTCQSTKPKQETSGDIGKEVEYHIHTLSAETPIHIVQRRPLKCILSPKLSEIEKCPTIFLVNLRVPKSLAKQDDTCHATRTHTHAYPVSNIKRHVTFCDVGILSVYVVGDKRDSPSDTCVSTIWFLCCPPLSATTAVHVKIMFISKVVGGWRRLSR